MSLCILDSNILLQQLLMVALLQCSALNLITHKLNNKQFGRIHFYFLLLVLRKCSDVAAALLQ